MWTVLLLFHPGVSHIDNGLLFNPLFADAILFCFTLKIVYLVEFTVLLPIIITSLII